MKYVQKHKLLKLPACTLEGAINNANQCWIQNITLPYVTGFVKIDPNHTGTEIQFIAEH